MDKYLICLCVLFGMGALGDVKDFDALEGKKDPGLKVSLKFVEGKNYHSEGSEKLSHFPRVVISRDDLDFSAWCKLSGEILSDRSTSINFCTRLKENKETEEEITFKISSTQKAKDHPIFALSVVRYIGKGLLLADELSVLLGMVEDEKDVPKLLNQPVFLKGIPGKDPKVAPLALGHYLNSALRPLLGKKFGTKFVGINPRNPQADKVEDKFVEIQSITYQLNYQMQLSVAVFLGKNLVVLPAAFISVLDNSAKETGNLADEITIQTRIAQALAGS